MAQLCAALQYAHAEAKIVHRDLKPANIMGGAFGEVQVMDWGLAKVMDMPCTADSQEIPLHPVSGTGTATMLGQAVGTPALTMSAESVRSRNAVPAVGRPQDAEAPSAFSIDRRSMMSTSKTACA